MLLKELSYILAIEKYGSVSEAAKHLYISQPALSKYIHSLEETLDTKLLDNVGRNVILTEAGKSYTKAARDMMDIYDDMSRNLLCSDNMIHGSLRIGVTFTRSPMLLPEVLAKFCREYPNVEIQLFEENSYNLEAQLADGQIDLIVAKGPITNADDFTCHPLFTEEFLLGLHKNHPKIGAAILSSENTRPWLDLNEIRDERFILLKAGHHTRFMADQLFAQHGFLPSKTILTSNIETAIGLAETGLGAVFVPSFFTLKNCSQKTNLCFFSVGGAPLQRTYTEFNIVHRKKTHHTKYAMAFIQIMQEHCQALFASREQPPLKDCPADGR